MTNILNTAGEVLFEGQAGERLKETLERAVIDNTDLRYANLTDADLTDADLTGADLTGADLTDAKLTGAELRYANLAGANLAGADLTDANLTGAKLTGADLTDANLADANLKPIQNDFYRVISEYPNEVPALREAVIEGRIDGLVYSGECACLCGTIAKAKGMRTGKDLPEASINSPIERFFLGIQEGDTPETSQLSAIVLEWIDEFVSNTK